MFLIYLNNKYYLKFQYNILQNNIMEDGIYLVLMRKKNELRILH